MNLKRAKTYPLDLRQRVLIATEEYPELTQKEIARIYSVSPSFVCTLVSSWDSTKGWESIAPLVQIETREEKIGPEVWAAIEIWCDRYPKTTLEQYQNLIFAHFDLEVSVSTIWRAFKKRNYVVKVVQYIHKNKFTAHNMAYYSEYCGWLAEQRGSDLHFFDESFFDEHVFLPRRGCAPKGVVINGEHTTRGKHVYSLCLMTSMRGHDPPYFARIVEGSCDGSAYVDFFIEMLKSGALQAGATVVVDNCKTHTNSWSGEVVAALLKAHNINYVFLPAYSPELNPCELTFAQVKAICSNYGDVEVLVGIARSLTHVTIPDMIGYYNKCSVFI